MYIINHLYGRWWKTINMTYRYYDVLVALCHNDKIKRKNEGID